MYISVKELAARLGVSVPSIWKWAGKGPEAIPDFPKPIKLGPQVTRWKLSEIEEWESRCAAKRHQMQRVGA